jgi:DIX domain
MMLVNYQIQHPSNAPIEPTVGSFQVDAEKLSLNDLKNRFPFEGSFHFRCKVVPSSDQSTFIWLDLVDDSSILVAYENIISVKALPLDSLLGNELEQEWPYLPSQYEDVRSSINNRIETVSTEIAHSISRRSEMVSEDGGEEEGDFEPSEIDSDLQPYPGMQEDHSTASSVTSAIKGFFTSATSAIEKAAEKLTHHSQASSTPSSSSSTSSAPSSSSAGNFMSGLTKGFQRVKMAAASAVAAATGEGAAGSNDAPLPPTGKGAVFTSH